MRQQMLKKVIRGSTEKDRWFVFTGKYYGVRFGAATNDGNSVHARQDTS